MLPHARPGGIAGLLEILIDRGGKDDIYHLADELAMEVDDLLPIVEAAALLGFIRVQEGDVEITPEGTAFAEADILHPQGAVPRGRAATTCTLLRQINNALRAKTDHTLPDEFFSRHAGRALQRGGGRGASWRPPSTGAATPSSSITTPRAAGCIPDREG